MARVATHHGNREAAHVQQTVAEHGDPIVDSAPATANGSDKEMSEKAQAQGEGHHHLATVGDQSL